MTERPVVPRPARPPRDSLAAYLDADGRLLRFPSRRQPRELVLDHLAALFAPGRDYTEGEVNDVLSASHAFGDAALLRRALYDSGRLDRDPDGSRYRRR